MIKQRESGKAKGEEDGQTVELKNILNSIGETKKEKLTMKKSESRQKHENNYNNKDLTKSQELYEVNV